MNETTSTGMLAPDSIPATVFTITLPDGEVTLDFRGKLHVSKPGLIDAAAEIFFRKVEELAQCGPLSTPAEIRAVGNLIRTQDGRATAEPVFIVQQRQRDYGYDTVYFDDAEIVWLDEEGNEVDKEEAARCEAEFDAGRGEPDCRTRTAFKDRWEFVTACFTEVGAKAFIAAAGHRLKDPRVYVDSAYRNAEWIAMRAFLKGLKP